MGVNVLCIIQARYGSKRLPGKMLMKVGGETLIERAYRLACEAFGKDRVVIATPHTEEDFTLTTHLYNRGIYSWMYRGDENDVLGRFYQVASIGDTEGRVIHRWTPDDWRKGIVLSRHVARGEKGIPVEMGGEACTFAQLKEWHETVTDPFLREHIGHLITPNPVQPPDDGIPWSIDTEADLIAANNSLCTERV